MRVKEFEKLARARPFRPLEIKLENGDRVALTYPEKVLIARSLVFVIDRDEEYDFIAPGAISEVRILRRNGRR